MNLAMKLNNTGINTARPFPHQSKKNLWLMPVKFKDDRVEFFLGHNFSKIFLLEDVGSFDHINIDSKESYNPLVHLMIVKVQNNSPAPPDSVLQSEIYLYLPPFGEESNEVGWRCTENWYTLIVKEEVLNKLRGREIDESNYEILEESSDLFKRLQQHKRRKK